MPPFGLVHAGLSVGLFVVGTGALLWAYALGVMASEIDYRIWRKLCVNITLTVLTAAINTAIGPVGESEYGQSLMRPLLACMTVGLVWQFVLAMGLVGYEQRSLRWSRIREAMWLRSPRSPKTGRVGGVLWGDANGNGVFGDRTKTLTNGTFIISTKATSKGQLTISATDGPAAIFDTQGGGVPSLIAVYQDWVVYLLAILFVGFYRLGQGDDAGWVTGQVLSVNGGYAML